MRYRKHNAAPTAYGQQGERVRDGKQMRRPAKRSSFGIGAGLHGEAQLTVFFGLRQDWSNGAQGNHSDN